MKRETGAGERKEKKGREKERMKDMDGREKEERETRVG